MKSFPWCVVGEKPVRKQMVACSARPEMRNFIVPPERSEVCNEYMKAIVLNIWTSKAGWWSLVLAGNGGEVFMRTLQVNPAKWTSKAGYVGRYNEMNVKCSGVGGWRFLAAEQQEERPWTPLEFLCISDRSKTLAARGSRQASHIGSFWWCLENI